jgi:hypothetical protein
VKSSSDSNTSLVLNEEALVSEDYDPLVPNSVPTSLFSFLSNSIHSFAHLAMPFAIQTWLGLANITATASTGNNVGTESRQIALLQSLDRSYDSIVSTNHISYRASKAQGSALITLTEKGFIDQNHPFYSTLISLKKDIRVSYVLLFFLFGI